MLSNGFGLDGLSLGGNADHILGHLGHLLVVALVDQSHEVADTLLVDGLPLGCQRQQPLQGPDCLVHHFLIPGDLQVGSPIDDAHAHGILDSLDILVEGAENGNDILQTIRIDNSFNDFAHAGLHSPNALCRSSLSTDNARSADSSRVIAPWSLRHG